MNSTEVALEEVAARRRTRIGLAVEIGLVGALLRNNYQFCGLSLKYSEVDVLLTIKVVSGEGPQVCFVGSETFGGALLKAERDIHSGKAKFREDRWAK